MADRRHFCARRRRSRICRVCQPEQEAGSCPADGSEACRTTARTDYSSCKNPDSCRDKTAAARCSPDRDTGGAGICPAGGQDPERDLYGEQRNGCSEDGRINCRRTGFGKTVFQECGQSVRTIHVRGRGGCGLYRIVQTGGKPGNQYGIPPQKESGPEQNRKLTCFRTERQK